MSKKQKILIITILLLLLLATPVVVLLWAPMAYSGLAGWIVRESTGLEFTVEDLEVDLMPVRITGSGLRLSNPHADFNDTLVTARQFAIEADLSGWWSSAPTWWSADATGVQVQAARNEAGAGNWDVPSRGTSDDSSTTAETSPLYRFSSVSIEELEFHRIVPEQNHVFTARQLSLARDADERLSIELDGNYQDEEVTVSGTVALPTSEQARDIDIMARFPGGRIDVNGRVGHDGIVPGMAEFSLRAENLSGIGRLLDQDLSAFDPVAITGRLEAPEPDHWVLAAEGHLDERPLELAFTMKTSDQRYIAENFQIEHDGEVLHGQGEIDLTAKSAKIQINAEAVDVDQLAELVETGDDSSAKDDSLAKLAGWNVEIVASAKELLFRDYRVLGLEGQATLESGTVRGALSLDSAQMLIRSNEGADGRERRAIVLTQPLQLEAELQLDVDNSDGRTGLRAIDATVSTAGVKASLDATLSPDTYLFESGELQARVDDLTAFEGLDLPAIWSRTLLPVNIRLTGQPGPVAWRLDPVRIEIPETTLTGMMSIDRSRQPIHFSGRLHADQLDINRLRTTAGLQEQQENKRSEGVAGDRDVFSETPLDWDWLRAANADLEISLDQLAVNQTVFSNVALKARLADARLQVDPIAADLSEGGVRGHATLAADGDEPEMAVELVVTKLAPADLGLKDAGLIDGGYTNLLVNLQSRGLSPQALASHMDGEFAVEVQNATIRNDLFDLVGSDLFTQFIGLINPFVEQDDRTSLECAAAYMKAEKGVLESSDRIVIETTKMKVRGSALIDLESESVLIDFQPSARQGLGIGLGDITSVVHIGGTLGELKVETGAAGVVKAGATLGAAVATGGLSILAKGVFDRLQNAGGTACGKIFERATDTEIPEVIDHRKTEPSS